MYVQDTILQESMKVLVAQLCRTLCTTMTCSPPDSVELSRQESWGGCHSLCQGIFLTQGSNPGLSNCRQILYHLSHQGSPCFWALRTGPGYTVKICSGAEEETGNLQKHFVSYSDVLNKSLVYQLYLIKHDKLQQNLRVHSIFNTLTMLYFIFFEIKKSLSVGNSSNEFYMVVLCCGLCICMYSSLRP